MYAGLPGTALLHQIFPCEIAAWCYVSLSWHCGEVFPAVWKSKRLHGVDVRKFLNASFKNSLKEVPDQKV